MNRSRTRYLAGTVGLFLFATIAFPTSTKAVLVTWELDEVTTDSSGGTSGTITGRFDYDTVGGDYLNVAIKYTPGPPGFTASTLLFAKSGLSGPTNLRVTELDEDGGVGTNGRGIQFAWETSLATDPAGPVPITISPLESTVFQGFAFNPISGGSLVAVPEPSACLFFGVVAVAVGIRCGIRKRNRTC